MNMVETWGFHEYKDLTFVPTRFSRFFDISLNISVVELWSDATFFAQIMLRPISDCHRCYQQPMGMKISLIESWDNSAEAMHNNYESNTIMNE